MLNNHETTDLLTRMSTGDQSAFAELYTLHRERLKQMLAHRIDRRLLARTDLSDILQDVYIDALKRIEHYLKHPEYSFYVWLRQVTMQRMIETHRQHLLAEKRSIRSEAPPQRSNFNSTSSQGWVQQFVANQISPSQAMMQQELVARVERTLEMMDAMDREVLVLRHFEEMRNSEIAEVLGLTEAAASNRYVRALLRLRQALNEETAEG